MSRTRLSVDPAPAPGAPHGPIELTRDPRDDVPCCSASDHLIGYYGIAVIVNAQNPVSALSEKQVADIFTGKVTNWNAVGGPDLPIRIFIRDPVSGTNLGFRELAMENASYAPTTVPLPRYADIVNQVASTPGGVGYTSMALADSKATKAVNIGRHSPNQLTVNEGWYPYARMLLLYTNQEKESEAVRDFIRFVQRADGQKIMDELGFVRRFEKKLKSYEID